MTFIAVLYSVGKRKNVFIFAAVFLNAEWFRSSVGLEQQPSKLWVARSNRAGITKSGRLLLQAA